MGILNKLATLTRGAARESAEVLLDANAIRIFEQEIVDVEGSIRLRKQTMSEMLVARKQLDREVESVEIIIAKRESQASASVNNDDDAELIDDIASDIVQYEEMLLNLKMQSGKMSKRILSTEATLRKAIAEVTQYRRDLRLVKAQQMNTSLLAKENNLPKQLGELEHTRQHIAALQTSDDDREAVWEEVEQRIDPHGLDKKMGGIDYQKRKEAVLARIKKTAA